MLLPEEFIGMNIGSYALSKLINWAKERYPDYSVEPIKISPVDAYPENKDQRNKFYQHHNFIPNYYDSELETTGEFMANKMADLTAHDTTDKITVLNIEDEIRTLIEVNEKHKKENIEYQEKLEYQKNIYENMLHSCNKINKILVIVILLGIIIAVSICYSS